jgi:hypothetical protein
MEKHERLKESKPMYKKLLTSTGFLTLGFWIIGLIVTFVGGFLAQRVPVQNGQDWYLDLALSMGLPWFMLGCIFVVLRKEVPRLGLPAIKGNFAVFQGVLGLIIISAVEFYIIYLLFQGK